MSKKSKSQIWLEYAAARAVLGFFGVLPRKAAVGLGISIATAAYPFLGGLRRAGTRSLEIAFPEKSPDERERILKKSFQNLGRILGEVSQFPRATPEKLARMIDLEFESEETRSSEEYKIYETERAKGRGVILVGPHLGNWEIGVFAYSAFREPLKYLARPIDNPLIEEMTVNLRTRFGNRPINKTNSVGKAIEILRTGGVLGVLPDVNAHPKEGVFVPFFGVEACTASGVAMLALRTNAMIIPMCCVWDAETKRYRAMYGKLVEPVRTGDRYRDIVETTALYTLEMEKFIRAYPDQWLWIHKRWKTRPPGEKELY
ncbi:MAG TPA: lysophospholipid acyltransferase family protein [Pyrinomonadaceae bacterium]|jgi:KDO2-lipid IV(A) lauroyltransferase